MYLTDKFKGLYRIKVPYDWKLNSFPRKLNGNFEDTDCYIDCQHGNKVFHYGRSILQAYIPSLQRGHNIITILKNDNVSIYNIEETDSEILFRFDFKDSEKVIPLLKPKTNGANISPFSSRNLPKNKSFSIPNEELSRYKEVIKNVPKNEVLGITHITNNYIKSLANKKNTWEDIKADMLKKCLKGKEYIYSIGKWDEYLRVLKEKL